jgi:hypothetical protein
LRIGAHQPARTRHPRPELRADTLETNSLSVKGDHGATCETAGHFFALHVQPRWQAFQAQLAGPSAVRCGHWRIRVLTCACTEEGTAAGESATAATAAAAFPFHAYFANAPQPLFAADATLAEARAVADGCYDGHLTNLFTQLQEMRGTVRAAWPPLGPLAPAHAYARTLGGGGGHASAFELVRSGFDRGTYLLTKEAKIIAMTCTHAALKRREVTPPHTHHRTHPKKMRKRTRHTHAHITQAYQRTHRPPLMLWGAGCASSWWTWPSSTTRW